MIQVHISVGDLHRGHLGSSEVTNRFLLIKNSRLKRDTDMGVVSLCLSCHDASTDVQHTYLGQHMPSRDLDLRSKIDVTIQSPCICFDAP